MKARSLAAMLLPAMVLVLVGLVALVAPAKPPAAAAVESTRPRAPGGASGPRPYVGCERTLLLRATA
jgi:hypothetical protein